MQISEYGNVEKQQGRGNFSEKKYCKDKRDSNYGSANSRSNGNKKKDRKNASHNDEEIIVVKEEELVKELMFQKATEAHYFEKKEF